MHQVHEFQIQFEDESEIVLKLFFQKSAKLSL